MTKENLKGLPIKDRIGPLISRISPVLKRKSLPQSPSKESASENLLHESLTLGTTDTVPVANKDMCKEEFESVESTFIPNEDQSSQSEEIHSCSQCKFSLAENQRLQEGKLQVEKQLVKAREEVQMLSELIKDMERKWTEVAKDYEKQVKIAFLSFSMQYLNYNFIISSLGGFFVWKY